MCLTFLKAKIITLLKVKWAPSIGKIKFYEMTLHASVVSFFTSLFPKAICCSILRICSPHFLQFIFSHVEETNKKKQCKIWQMYEQLDSFCTNSHFDHINHMKCWLFLVLSFQCFWITQKERFCVLFGGTTQLNVFVQNIVALCVCLCVSIQILIFFEFRKKMVRYVAAKHECGFLFWMNHERIVFVYNVTFFSEFFFCQLMMVEKVAMHSNMKKKWNSKRNVSAHVRQAKVTRAALCIR